MPGLLVEHIENKTFPASLGWLFTTGRGATRQLLVYRQVRVPDLAACAFVSGTIAGVIVWILATPFGAAIPVAILLAISAQHVRSRFETPVARWRSVAAAIAIDAALLLAYFTGRVARPVLVDPQVVREERAGRKRRRRGRPDRESAPNGLSLVT